MKLFSTCNLLATAAATMIGMSASATTVIYEGFDYDTGQWGFGQTTNATGLTGNWSGAGWTTQAPTVVAGSLSYGALSPVGNSIDAIGGKNANASFGTSLDGLTDDGDTLWMSVLINVDSAQADMLTNGGRDYHVALSSDAMKRDNNGPLQTGNGGNGFGIGYEGGTGFFGATWSGGSRSITGSTGMTGIAIDTTYMVVAEIIFGATDTINIYTPGTDLALGSVVATHSAAIDQSTLNRLTFANSLGSTVNSDEIRIGTTAESVGVAIPEPGSLALLGLGGLLVARRRRG